jgi:hypothetical protein
MSSQAEALLQIIGFFVTRDAALTGRARAIHVPHLEAAAPARAAKPAMPLHLSPPQPKKGDGHIGAKDGGFNRF